MCYGKPMAAIDKLNSNSDPDGTAEMPIAEHPTATRHQRAETSRVPTRYTLPSGRQVKIYVTEGHTVLVPPSETHLALRTGSFGTRLRRLLHGAIQTTEVLHDPREREVAREFMNAAFIRQVFSDLFFPDGSRQPSRALQHTASTNSMKSRPGAEVHHKSSLQQAPEPAGD